VSWPLVKLGEVANVTTGQSAPQDPNAFSKSGIPFIRAGSLKSLTADATEDDFDRISEDSATKYRLKVFPKNTVVFAKSGMSSKIGFVHRLNRSCYLVSHLAAVETDETKLSSRFLKRWFERKPPSLLIANDSYPSIRTSDIKSLEIPLPPLEEQRRIADILDKADAIRRKREKAIALTDNLLKSVFLDMFGNPTPNWVLQTVEGVAFNKKGSIRTGPFGSQLLHSEFIDSGVAVLGIDNAVDNKFRWAKSRYISENKYEELKRYTVYPGDILITIMGTCGRTAIVPDDCPLAINTKHLCCITLEKTKCLPSFLHSYFLIHPTSRKYLSTSAKGAVMDGLNMSIIKALPIHLPPINLQRKYDNFSKTLRQRKEQLELVQKASNNLLASLTQRAFRGQLTSKDFDIIEAAE